MVYDQRTAEQFAGMYPLPQGEAPYVLRADTDYAGWPAPSASGWRPSNTPAAALRSTPGLRTT